MSSPHDPRAGRRTGGRRGRPDLTVVLAVLLPPLTVLLLLSADAEAPEPASQAPRTTPLAAATLVCPTGLPGAGRVLVATAGAGRGHVVVGRDRERLRVAPGRPASTRSDPPLVVRAEDDLAPALLASRTGTAPLRALACIPPAAEQWFTGLGAGAEHASVIELVNPNAGPAVADVLLLAPDGPVDAPRLRGVLVPGGETRRVDLAAEVPLRGELSARVTTSRGRLAVAVEDTVDEVGRGRPARDWLPGQSAPSSTSLLLGSPLGSGGPRTLVLANPGDDEVRAEVRVLTERSAFAPRGLGEVRVPPRSVARVSLTASLASGPASDALGLQVDATGALTATLRSEAGGDLSHAVASTAVEQPTAVVVPEGRKRLLLGGAGADGEVTVRTRSAEGEVLATERAEVGPGRGVAVPLPRSAVVVEVTPGGTSVVGAVLVTGDGVAVVPLRERARSALEPGVRPALSAPLD